MWSADTILNHRLDEGLFFLSLSLLCMVVTVETLVFCALPKDAHITDLDPCHSLSQGGYNSSTLVETHMTPTHLWALGTTTINRL